MEHKTEKQKELLKQNLINCSNSLKPAIINLLDEYPCSKEMISLYLFIPQPYVTQYIYELLQAKQIVEIDGLMCTVTGQETPFYVSEKLYNLLKTISNEKRYP